MDTREVATPKPPYGSFATFWGFVETLGSKPLPPQIDRSVFAGKSGTDQSGILMALRWFGLVNGPQQTVRPELESLVSAKGEERKTQLASLIHSRYPGQLGVSARNGTEKMLLDSFEEEFGLTGDTRRKAATFFLHASRAAGISLSQNFPVTRSGPGSPAGSRAKRTTKRRASTPQLNGSDAQPKTPDPDEFTVNLKAGGSVTLVVNVGHFALSRHKEDREFVHGLIDQLTAYEEAGESVGVPDDEEAAD